MMFKKFFNGLLFFFFTAHVSSQIAFIGPMFHYNFGSNQDNHFSWGVEASVWYPSLIHNTFIPNGLDVGVEFEKKKFRLYGEIEVGFLAGVSLGYVGEFDRIQRWRGGFQGSVWLAYLFGFDFRYRSIDNNKVYAPGLFFKYPVGYAKIDL